MFRIFVSGNVIRPEKFLITAVCAVFVDTVAAYESGELAKLLGLEVRLKDDL